MILGFAQHGNVPGVQHVKGAEGDANLFAIGMQLFDVVEYH